MTSVSSLRSGVGIDGMMIDRIGRAGVSQGERSKALWATALGCEKPLDTTLHQAIIYPQQGTLHIGRVGKHRPMGVLRSMYDAHGPRVMSCVPHRYLPLVPAVIPRHRCAMRSKYLPSAFCESCAPVVCDRRMDEGRAVRVCAPLMGVQTSPRSTRDEAGVNAACQRNRGYHPAVLRFTHLHVCARFCITRDFPAAQR